MASSGKRKTTMAKLTRERRLHERRLDKQAKKEARKRAAADHPDHASEDLPADVADSAAPRTGQPDSEPVAPSTLDG